MAYVKIFSGSVVEVLQVKHVLEAQKIVPVVKDRANSASLAGFGAVTTDFQEVYVHSDEETKALDLLKSM